MNGYTKLKELGEGTYGRVFLVREKHAPARLVCIKQLHAAASREVSQNEIRLMKRVRHPNVVRFFDAFAATRHQHAIVMEFCSGGDLRAFLRQRQGRTRDSHASALASEVVVHENRVWYWFLQLCLALQHLHDVHKILHRDVKTANIFLSNSGFLVLGDLGVARDCSQAASPNASALASTVIGTPLYMPPEMWDGKPYDCACDLWALGCALYEICAGKPPFLAATTPALIRKVCDGTFAPLPSERWSPRLRELVRALLSVDPTRRPRAATILRQPENAVHLQRYLLDRRAVARAGDPAPTIPKATVEPARSVDANLPTMTSDSEQRLSAMREQERQEQLHVALKRLHALRLQKQLAADAGSNTREEAPPPRTQQPRNRVRATMADPDVEVAEWKEPVQVRPGSSWRMSGVKAVPLRKTSMEFAGIPRQGVPLTAQAKTFAAKSPPVCRDVRILRKKEFAKTAARYRRHLDDQFNSKRPVAATYARYLHT